MSKKKRIEVIEVPGAEVGWASGEFGTIELGDARIERRLRIVAEDPSHQPEYPINQANKVGCSPNYGQSFKESLS